MPRAQRRAALRKILRCLPDEDFRLRWAELGEGPEWEQGDLLVFDRESLDQPFVRADTLTRVKQGWAASQSARLLRDPQSLATASAYLPEPDRTETFLEALQLADGVVIDNACGCARDAVKELEKRYDPETVLSVRDV